jgi:hypothetical protein
MRARIGLTLVGAALAVLLLTAPANAFSVTEFDMTYVNEDGSPATQAGSHPFAVKTNVEFSTKFDPKAGKDIGDGSPKRFVTKLPPGFVGDRNAVPYCSTAEFLEKEFFEDDFFPVSGCPDSTAIGTFATLAPGETVFHKNDFTGAFNLVPPPGTASKIGFLFLNVPITVSVNVNPEKPHNLIATLDNTSQIEPVGKSMLTLWGNPAEPVHDTERGKCVRTESVCTADIPVRPFLTLPRSCEGPLSSSYEALSWEEPNAPVSGLSESLLETTGCDKLAFEPTISNQLSSIAAESGSGLDFNLDFEDEGLANPNGAAQSDIEKAVVTIPKGVTINPSVAEGLEVCTPAQLDKETVNSVPGAGCPEASKLGTLHVDTPIVDEGIDGSIFLAQQDDPSTTKPGAENPFDSLIALYFVLKNPTLGVILKLPVKVEPDAKTGQLQATLEDNPQLPFNHFNAHLRTGGRAALITPGACGSYETKAVLTPWANPAKPLTRTASFQISRGVGGGPCPPGGVPPFHPEFQAGSLNNNAGSFSPFNMRLIREDGEQDMTKFSAILPPGELGSLAGVGKCPDAAAQSAKSKTGRQEIASPSCPASALIGHTLAGAGVGGSLTYVPGKIYLGGAYNGAPLSVIAITPAVAGPFDAGTVVVRLALDLNPKTAEVEVDGAASDPIPHILNGIVLKLRDLRVYVDRPDFTLNPTNCRESSAKATLFGSFLDVLSPTDDVPVSLSTRYQAANCANLGFKPKLDLKLKGGTRRGGHPGLLGTYTPHKGDANLKGLVVRLPRSAFLDQAHIRTICTRVQFAAKACPKGAQYGSIKAFTPLLDTPLEGPVWLRSSSHKLPDLVFDLHGLVDIEVSTRIDSAKGGIRASLENLPDAPLSKVVLRMQGGKKGLIVNSRNLCGAVSKANVEYTGQNGKEVKANPVMQADCGGGRKHKRHSK